MRRLLTPGWILVHLAAIGLVIGFLWLCWWQVGRAAGGNLLSFGYAIEWPAFAVFTIYVWIKEMRRAVRASRPAGENDPAPIEPAAQPPVRRTRPVAAYDDEGDEELVSYNRYLAWLNANPHRPPAEYPG